MSSLEQNTPEWLEMRKSKIGASDAAIIMGVSPWCTPYELWQRKLSLIEDIPETFSMSEGKRKEPLARQCFEKITGLLVMPKIKFHDEYEWMMASLDGIDVERKYIVEIKCPGKEDHLIAEAGKIPEKYIPQLQHQMAVTGLNMAYYFSFYQDKGVIVEVYRDDSYIKKMIAKEKEFIECVKQFTPPALTEKDYTEMTDPVWLHTASKWKQAQKQLKELEQTEKELRESLIALSPSRNVQGAGVKLIKSQRKGAIKYNEIPNLKELNLESYRSPSIVYWKILNTGDACEQ